MKMIKQHFKVFLTTVLFFNIAVSFVHSNDLNDDFLYTVKKKDTIWGICKSYVADPLCWQKLTAYNELKNPKYLPPNSIIRIPKVWLNTIQDSHPTTALVIAVVGDVMVIRKGSAEATSLAVGHQLNQEDTVRALNGSAMIKFADESRLLLKANSTIRMSTLQFYDPTQLVNTRVELLKGRVRAEVKKVTNANSRYEIETPAAVAAVRGTEFRVGSDLDAEGNALMRAELLTGALQVASDNNAQQLSAGEAVMAIEGKGVSEPVKLLPPPEMKINGARSFQLPYDLKWKNLDKAVSYKVALVRDGQELWEKDTQETKISLQGLDSGRFEILIRGIDEQGFEGRNRLVKVNLP
jgi:hypothetical protein